MAYQKMSFGWDHGKFVLLVQDYDDSLIARISMKPDEAALVAQRVATPEDQRVFVFEECEAAFESRSGRIEALLARYFQWVEQTFPEETVAEQTSHLQEEFLEMLSHPRKADEYADVLMLLLCVARGNGVDLLEAFRSKFEVNKGRQWEKTDRGYRHKQ